MNYVDAHLFREFAAQDACSHQCAVLRERPRPVGSAAMPAGTGRKLRPVLLFAWQFRSSLSEGRDLRSQIRQFVSCELEREIFRKAATVPLHRFVEALRGHTVPARKICIENDAMPTDRKNQGLERCSNSMSLCGRHRLAASRAYLTHLGASTLTRESRP
jgi:hypothetical protein